MKNRKLKYWPFVFAAMVIAGSPNVLADTILIDFEQDGELGRVDAPFTSADSSLVHFSSLGVDSSNPSLPLSVLVLTASGVNAGATDGIGLTSDNFLFDNELQIEFDVPVSSLSLDFGNDDPKDLPPPGPDGDLVPGVDLANLTVFNGMTQVGQAATVVNGNNLMDQTVSFSGAVFDRAVFAYTRPSGDLIIALTEFVDNIEFELAVCSDVDGDGFGQPGSDVCPNGDPEDCDDLDATVFPGAPELPGNATDENCDGSLGSCDPFADWRNHGQFVRCVAHEVNDLVDAGTITQEQGDDLVTAAAQSDVGK